MVILGSTNKKSYLVVASLAACYSRHESKLESIFRHSGHKTSSVISQSAAVYVILHNRNLSVPLLSHVMGLSKSNASRKKRQVKNLHSIIAEVPL